MKIEEITSGMNDVDTFGEITDISEPKEISTKFGRTRVATATLKDETGEIDLALWGNQIEMVHVGDQVEIKGGYTKEFKGKLQLNVGKRGSITVR